MKKDLDKLLSRTLFTYGTVLFVVFALKLFGLDYFGLDTDNKIINQINDFVMYWRLENVWYAITLYLNCYIVMSITTNDNSKNMKKFTLYLMPFFLLFQYLKTHNNIPYIFVIIDLLYMFILSICYTKIVKKDKIHKYNVGNYWLFMFACTIYQMISISIRNLVIQSQTLQENNFIVNIIINFDYLILMIITYKLYFIKGGKSLWVMVHCYFSDLLISLKSLPKKLQKSYQRSKPQKRENELAYKIYLVLFWLYNFFTVATVLFIATLNETFIECIFILSSFWINKGVFGKPFHLKKASTCFVVSSLSYYILNRLTWKVGISFLIPIVLGISLSYITSKFMARKENIVLYRGMPLDKFYELIIRVTDNREHIEMCKMYYVDKQTIVKIAMKFNYSEIRIKQIKAEIVKKVKELDF